MQQPHAIHNASADVEATTRCFLELIRKKVYSIQELEQEQGYFEKFQEKNPELIKLLGLNIKPYGEEDLIEEKVENNRTRVFQTYSIRLAMGLGRLDRFNREENIIDGEAIYRSGRAISSESTHNKERMVIKNTLFFSSINDELNLNIDAIISLLDHLLARATSRQSEVLFLKIMGNSEKVIAKKLGISQSSINQHSTASGWNGMDKAIKYFTHTLSKIS